MTDDPYQAADVSAARLAKLSGQASHDIAVVLGSGWAPVTGILSSALGATDTAVPMTELGFPETTVPGHRGMVYSLASDKLRVLVFAGRVHLYEGHPPSTVVHNVRVAQAAGCRVIVLTNAAGGLREGYHVGQPVLIRDHINLTGASPLSGPPPPPGYPERFTDLTQAYSPRLRALARAADPDLTEGVYAGLTGPSYETPAETGMLRLLGADLVGMSTVHEVIAARHLGAEVLAISLVTNLVAGLTPDGPDHGEVLSAGAASADRMGHLLGRLLPTLVPA